ncbi:hypothetical protein MMC09_002595 [Bachmanniomyces sp. S44760]|nr:hypothetical protein [Bachmanniomyces sp. S44760]
MLRHGYLSAPIYWREVSIPGQVKGLWVIHDELAEPDIIVYYAHGGGFSMGSSYFYLEFLLAWLSLLKTVAGYKNPAIFALEYTLVPDAAFPVQLQETVKGYEYVLSRLPNPTDASKVCVAGDSAGATLILTFLLYISRHDSSNDHSIANGTLDKINGNTDSHEHGSLNDTMHTIPVPKPGYATLISPWVSLVRSDNRDTPSDYLNASALEVYGSQYACGDTCKSLLIESVQSKLHNPLVSPFACKDPQWLRRSAPTHGYFITFGAEEVFAPSIASMVAQLRKAGVSVAVREEPGGIHAWPVASLFLSGNYGGNGRLDGLMRLARTVGENVR